MSVAFEFFDLSHMTTPSDFNYFALSNPVNIHQLDLTGKSTFY